MNRHWVNERKRIFLLVLIMVGASLIVAAITLSMLYAAAFKEARNWLVEAAQSQARLIETAARSANLHFSQEHGGDIQDYARSHKSGTPRSGVLAQIIEAHTHYQHSGRTTEFLLGQRQGDQIVFLFRHRHGGKPEYPQPVAFESNQAEPMRRALSGLSGTLIGLDHRQKRVLAAYEPVAGLNAGIVTKIDLREIRAPFIKAGMIAVFFSILVVTAGAILFWRISSPMVRRIEERAVELAKLNDQLSQEINDRKAVEEALSKSEKRFRELSENINEVFWLRDIETGEMLYISPMYEKIWGRTCESLYRNPDAFMEAVHPDDMERIKRAQETQKRGKDFNETYRIAKPDGTLRWIRARSFPVRDEAGEVYRLAGIAEDITDKIQMEKRLEHAQQMDAVAALAGGIAHEFNNALFGISGNIDLLQMKLADDQRVSKHIDAMRTSAQRMTHLTGQLLAYAKGGKYQPRHICLNGLVEDTLALVHSKIDSAIRIDTDLGADIPGVRADFTQIQMVFFAIISNAAEAIEGQGWISIRTAKVEMNEAITFEHPDLKPGIFICVSVEDSGIGMDAQTRSKIFEPFFTTKIKGRGLGMAAVYGIVRNHNGWIEVTSHPGKGTLVRFYLPAVKP